MSCAAGLEASRPKNAIALGMALGAGLGVALGAGVGAAMGNVARSLFPFRLRSAREYA